MQAKHPFQSHLDTRKDESVVIFNHWHGNAYLLLLNRGCVPMTTNMYDFQRHLQQNDIAVAMFEGNFADCRDIDETGVLDRLEAFLEGQGDYTGAFCFLIFIISLFCRRGDGENGRIWLY